MKIEAGLLSYELRENDSSNYSFKVNWLDVETLNPSWRGQGETYVWHINGHLLNTILMHSDSSPLMVFSCTFLDIFHNPDHQLIVFCRSGCN
jgi:hypothetical protein